MLTRNTIKKVKKIRSYEEYIEGYWAWKKAKVKKSDK